MIFEWMKQFSHLGIVLWDKFNSVNDVKFDIDDGTAAILLCERSNLTSFVKEFDSISLGIDEKLFESSFICFKEVGKGGIGDCIFWLCCCIPFTFLGCCVCFGRIPRALLPAAKVCKFFRLVIGWRLWSKFLSKFNDLIFVNVLCFVQRVFEIRCVWRHEGINRGNLR